jgi:DNA polymerase III delta prime subunit
MKLVTPKLLERKAPKWQMQKLELAQVIIDTNRQIVEQNERMIEILTLQYTAMVDLQKLFRKKLKAKGGC